MAKNINQVFQDARETMYAEGLTPLQTLTLNNRAVRFLPPAKDAHYGANLKYNIQRLKRIKAQDRPANTGKAGDDLVNLLNTAQKIDWETISTQAATPRSILLNMPKNESFDFDNVGSAQERTFSTLNRVRMLENEEQLLQLVLEKNGAAAKVDEEINLTDLTEAIGDQFRNAIEKGIYNIQFKTDEFKYFSDNVVVMAHPLVLRALARTREKLFAPDGNIFLNGNDTGLKGSYQFDKTQVLSNSMLNVFEVEEIGSTGKIKPLVIILDAEALAQADPSLRMSLFDDSAIKRDVVNKGITYDEILKLIDPTRIHIIGGTLPSGTTNSDKVSA